MRLCPYCHKPLQRYNYLTEPPQIEYKCDNCTYFEKEENPTGTVNYFMQIGLEEYAKQYSKMVERTWKLNKIMKKGGKQMKKKAILIALLLVLVAPLAFANDMDDTFGYVKTTNADYKILHPYMSKYFDHNHEVYIDRQNDSVGVGQDLIWYKSENPFLEKVATSYRYDFENSNHTVYTYGTAYVPGMIKAIGDWFTYR